MEKPANNSEETIVVTGGAGFMGQHIVRQLLEQNLFPLREIRIFDIQEFKWFPGMEPYNNQSKAELTTIKGDICEINELRGACRDATTVIHSAALIDVTTLPDEAKIKHVNVKGTENVIQVCVDNNVSRLVYTSSVDAYISPDPFPTSDISEAEVSTPTKFLMGPYASSKHDAENLVIQANGSLLKNGMRLSTCALRIPFMYGEGDRIARDFMKLPATKKKFFPLGDDSNIVEKIYAGNAAWAHVLVVHTLLQKDPADSTSSPAGKAMFIGDDTPRLSLSGHVQPFVNNFGATNGVAIPFGVIYAAGIFIEYLGWILQPVCLLRTNMTPWSMIFARNNYTVSCDLARRCLGYAPLYSYDQAVSRSMFYLKETLIGPE